MSGPTLESMLAANAARDGDRVALHGARSTTWRELDAQVRAASSLLFTLGIGEGDRVATVLGNREEFLVMFWACVATGAVFVPLSPLLLPATLRKIMADASPKLVLFDGAAPPQVPEIAKAQGALFLALGDGEPPPWRAAAAAGHVRTARIAPDAPCNVIYSSGTTGDPKGIVHSRQVRAAYARTFARAFRIEGGSTVLHAGSLVFNGAFISMLPACMAGATYCFLTSATAQDVIAAAVRLRATHIVMVPSLIAQLLGQPSFDREHLPSIETLVSLGAPLPLEHKRHLEALFPGRVAEMYGLTEGIVTVQEAGSPAGTLASVGRAPPFCEVAVVDEQGARLPPGQAGEIVGRSPLVMSGYLGRPQLTAATLRGGWVHSGDIGYLDEGGYLYVVGRRKEMLITGGVNVYPRDIEEVAATHPDVQEVAVFGVPHERWGETPVAALRVRQGANATAEALKEWVNGRVGAKFQRIAAAWIVDDLPRNTAGKVLKDDLRRRFLAVCA